MNPKTLRNRIFTRFCWNFGEFVNSFTPLHYGTFWGLPTRIFYVFVGLAPLVLFITGFVMWWYRRQVKGDRSQHLKPN